MNEEELLALIVNGAKVILFFSGGKDFLACLFRLLELGVSKEQIELWHPIISQVKVWRRTNDTINRFIGKLLENGNGIANIVSGAVKRDRGVIHHFVR